MAGAVSTEIAAAQALTTAERAVSLADEVLTARPPQRLHRVWDPRVRCHRYHVVARADGLPASTVSALSALLFGAAQLDAQPWFPQHRGGHLLSVPTPASHPVLRHAWCITQHSQGLALPRAQSLLLSEVALDDDTRVIVQRSVSDGPPLPDGTVRTLLLAPTVDIIRHHEDAIHWHGITTSPSRGVAPSPFDTIFESIFRRLGLDVQERNRLAGRGAGIEALLRTPEALGALLPHLASTITPKST